MVDNWKRKIEIADVAAKKARTIIKENRGYDIDMPYNNDNYWIISLWVNY